MSATVETRVSPACERRGRVGVCVLATDRSLPPPAIARAVEERGIDMLFLPENSHIPLVRRRDWPNAEALLDPLSRLYDPFVALSAAAAVTSELILGFAVCLLTHRDPINTAKAIASLDLLSQGRVVLGVAGGSLDEAMRNHGTPFAQRWKVVRERTLAMRRIWREEVAEFHGEFVDFAPLQSYPKPVQAGGPPIWIGSNSRWVPGRVAEYADGWMVYNGRFQGDPVAALQAACARTGRDFDSLTLALMDAPWDADELMRFADRGFSDFILLVPPHDGDVRRDLDRAAGIARRLRQAA